MALAGARVSHTLSRLGFRIARLRADLLLGRAGVSPLGWGDSETAPLLRGLGAGARAQTFPVQSTKQLER